MSLTIYTISDPATIGNALTGIAMFFGQDSWVGTAIKTALMLSLILVLAQTVTNNGLRLDVMLTQLIVIWALFLPKTTVTIEQFNNASAPRVVDDVPYAVALPASLAGSFSLYMTEKLETVMSSVNGNYLSVSGEMSPFTPARILMSFTTCPLDPLQCMDQNTVETMTLAARYCSGGELSNARFEKTSDVLTTFANTLTKSGSTIIYDSTNPFVSGGGGGRAATCDEAASYIRGLASAAQSGTGSSLVSTMQSIASRSNVQSYNAVANANAGQETDWNTSLEMINKVTNANSNLDSLALSNILSYSIASSLKYNAQNPIDSSINIKSDTGLFEWAKADAQQSMLVSATAPKFMDVLFFIFIASTPIVMFVVAANPSSGLKVAGSYALFGLWTQSWIPMMAIITYWYQSEIQNYPAPITGEGMTVEYVAGLMHHVMTSTISAANMIQNAPYIMFAIMSGSMFAMANLIGKASPGSNASESAGGATHAGGGASGGAGRLVGAGSSGIPAMSQLAAIQGGAAALAGGLASNAAGPMGDVAANAPGLPELTVGGSVSNGVSAANERSAALRQQLSAQRSRAMAETVGLIESAANTLGGEKTAQMMRDAGYSATYNASTGRLTSNIGTIDFRAGQTNSTSAGSGAKYEIGVASDKEVFGAAAALISGGYAKAGVGGEFSKGQKQDSSLGQGHSQSFGSEGRSGNGVSTHQGASGGTGSRGSSGSNWSKMGEEAKRLSNTFQKIAAETKALDEADKLVRQGGASAQAGAGAAIKGADVAQNWGAVARNQNGGKSSANIKEAEARVLSAVSGSMSPDRLPQLQKAMDAEIAKMDASGQSRALNKDQIAAVAAWRAMSNMASSNDAGVKMDGLNGMAKLAAASGMQDLTEPLRNVSQGLGIIKDVEGKISQMGAEVRPTVAAAVNQVGEKTSDENADKFKNKVHGHIEANKNKAGETLRGTEKAAAQLPAEGRAALDAERKKVDEAENKNQDPALLAKKAADATERQAVASVVPQDQSDYGSGRNTNGVEQLRSLTTNGIEAAVNFFSRPTPEAPANALTRTVDGATHAGTTAAAGVVQAVNGAANAGTGATPGLPTLGNGGPPSSTTRMGGGQPPATPGAPPGGKPNMKFGDSGKDAKGPIPGR